MKRILLISFTNNNTLSLVIWLPTLNRWYWRGHVSRAGHWTPRGLWHEQEVDACASRTCRSPITASTSAGRSSLACRSRGCGPRSSSLRVLFLVTRRALALLIQSAFIFSFKAYAATRCVLTFKTHVTTEWCDICELPIFYKKCFVRVRIQNFFKDKSIFFNPL